jgi:hypothetical protein
LSFNCYPNPVIGELNIHYNLNNAERLKIELFNLLGEKVFSQVFFSKNLNGIYSINIKDLPNGSYLVKLADGDIQNSKIITVSH